MMSPSQDKMSIQPKTLCYEKEEINYTARREHSLKTITIFIAVKEQSLPPDEFQQKRRTILTHNALSIVTIIRPRLASPGPY